MDVPVKHQTQFNLSWNNAGGEFFKFCLVLKLSKTLINPCQAGFSCVQNQLTLCFIAYTGVRQKRVFYNRFPSFVILIACQ